jgi:hypothetical protein
MKKFGRLASAALIAGAAMLASGSGAFAQSQDLLVQNDAEAAQAGLTSLMQPVESYLTGNAQNTTNITQIGSTNFATSGVTGTSNIAMIQQGGRNNRAVQAIQGNSSALLLVQGGSNNNVLQASVGDRNFQLVGVSGSNNNVAYVQKGNDLAGALDVRDAHNTTVAVLQTPQTGRYLMPTGIRGLSNAYVVIVPGRMYVMPKK